MAILTRYFISLQNPFEFVLGPKNQRASDESENLKQASADPL